MSDVPLICPECAGERLVGPNGEPDSIHPAGILTIQHKPGCTIRDRQDATHAADVANAATYTETDYYGTPRGQFKRPITPTELLILRSWAPRLNTLEHDHLDEKLTEDLMTYVTGITYGILNRSWPTLWTWFPPTYDTLADSYRKSRWIDGVVL